MPRDTTPALSPLAPATAQPYDASDVMASGTAAAGETGACAAATPLAIVSDFWLVVGEHLTELNAPTDDATQPLHEQLIARGKAVD